MRNRGDDSKGERGAPTAVPASLATAIGIGHRGLCSTGAMSRDILPEHPAELTLLDYLVGHLPPDVADQIRRHVSSCRACRRTIAELSLTVDELDRLPTVPIPHDAIADAAAPPQAAAAAG